MLHRTVRHSLGVLAVLTAASLLTPSAAAAAAGGRAPAAAGQWTSSTAATNGPDNSFNGVDALNPNDVWAVGATNLYTQGSLSKTLAEHWNGTRWSIVPSPNAANIPSTGVVNSNVLNAVDAVSANDVWAVGYSGINGFSGSASLVEHWNGQAWSIVTSPNGVLPSFNFYNVLLGVSGTSATDVWAVGWNGFLFQPSNQRATIQHWNGTRWALTSVPPIGNNAKDIVVQAVTALSPTDAWAAGYYSDDSDAPITHPFTLHWNGSQWSVVATPEVSLGTTVNQVKLSAIKAVSATDLWAVGNVSYVDAQGAGQVQALIEHWNGAQWSVVRSPVIELRVTTLTGIAPFASNDIWAVGTSGTPTNDGIREPLLEHWDGATWSVVPAAAVNKNYNCGFFAGAATSGGAEAVGACIASDSTTQPHATPLVQLFR